MPGFAVDRPGSHGVCACNPETARPAVRFSLILHPGGTAWFPGNHADLKMKIKNSLKALKARHRDNRLVRRKGRVYIINKQNPRFKARQG